MTLVERQFAYCGIDKNHEQGYKGQGVTILNCEGLQGSHGQDTTSVLRLVAPEATILNCDLTTIESGNGIQFWFNYKGNKYTADEMYDLVKPDILNLSLANNNHTHAGEAQMQRMVERGAILFNSIGNDDGEVPYGRFKCISITVGAVAFQSVNGLDPTIPTITNYSMPNPMFVAFEGDERLFGTSFSCPFLAGQTALLIQKYGKKNQSQMMKFLKANSKYLGDTAKYGQGIVIMPEGEAPHEEDVVPLILNDVTADRWSYQAIKYCSDKGYLKGYPDGSFRPEKPVTREELAVIIQRMGL